METKTAKDLPTGSDVHARGVIWSKADEDLWGTAGGARINDGQVDRLLSEGAQIVFVPAGRGRWLAQREKEVDR